MAPTFFTNFCFFIIFIQLDDFFLYNEHYAVLKTPNAAVFSSDYLTIDNMVKSGFWMTIVAIFVIVVFVYFWQPVVLNY